MEEGGGGEGGRGRQTQLKSGDPFLPALSVLFSEVDLASLPGWRSGAPADVSTRHVTSRRSVQFSVPRENSSLWGRLQIGLFIISMALTSLAARP